METTASHTTREPKASCGLRATSNVYVFKKTNKVGTLENALWLLPSSYTFTEGKVKDAENTILLIFFGHLFKIVHCLCNGELGA